MVRSSINDEQMNKLKPILLFFYLILILIVPLFEAKEKRGADVLIRKTDETEVRGELIAVKSDSLLILDFKTGADITAYVNEIFTIKVIKKSHPWKGAKIGFLVGAALGAIYGLVWPGDEEPTAYFPMVYGATFAVPGVLAGAITSGMIAIDRTYPIQGLPLGSVNVTLNDLRKKARVKDFN